MPDSLSEEYPFHFNRKIAVVVPAYNEERLLGRTVQTVPPWVYMIFIIDDASTDGTGDVARDLKASDPRVVYRRHEENRGVGAAIATGYKLAKELGCDIAVVMAGDAQMDPADMERLLYPVISQCAGYAKGNRLEHPEAAAMPIVRRLGTQLLAKMTCAVADIPELGDMQCGYTAFDLGFLPLLDIDTLYSRYGYPNDLVLRLAAANIDIVDVPVRPIYRTEVSGLVPHKVILPISKILAKGLLRRARKKITSFKPK